MNEHPCTECGEPTLDPERCRDCDLDRLFKQMECEFCRNVIYGDNAEKYFRIKARDHAQWCPKYCATCGSRGCLTCGAKTPWRA